MGKMGPVPPGCCPKWPHAALLVTHLDQPNHTPRALSGTIWAGNAATWQVLTGPRTAEINWRRIRAAPALPPGCRSNRNKQWK